MNPAKWLQTAISITELTYSTIVARSLHSCFVENAQNTISTFAVYDTVTASGASRTKVFDFTINNSGCSADDLSGKRAKRASLEEDSSGGSREMATDGRLHALLN